MHIRRDADEPPAGGEVLRDGFEHANELGLGASVVEEPAGEDDVEGGRGGDVFGLAAVCDGEVEGGVGGRRVGGERAGDHGGGDVVAVDGGGAEGGEEGGVAACAAGEVCVQEESVSIVLPDS